MDNENQSHRILIADDNQQNCELLEAYLDRAVGAGWRAQADANDGREERTAGSGRQKSAGAASASGRMSVAEAREVLGVAAGASAEEIREAHRRLMKKLHPDLGGSNYLAGKINQARDVLLRT